MKIITQFLLNFKAYKKNFKRIKKSILDSRYFFDVEFKNTSNIQVSKFSNIERGSLLLVNDPINKYDKNIVIGDHCWIGKDVEMQTYYDTKVTIHDFASVQDRCKLLSSVSVGKYSVLAPDIFISSGNHYFNSNPFLTIREQDATELATKDSFLRNDKPVIIEEDCWLGKNVFVKRGTYIGRGAIIGTNSIVNNDVEPYAICAGSPAVKVRNRIDFNPPSHITPFDVKYLPYFYKGFEHYVPNKKILHHIEENKGIRSENTSLILMEKTDWKVLSVSGKGLNNGVLEVYCNGVLKDKVKIESESEFVISLYADKKISGGVAEEYSLLPDLIKKYNCVAFHFLTEDTRKKHNFIISKTEYHD